MNDQYVSFGWLVDLVKFGGSDGLIAIYGGPDNIHRLVVEGHISPARGADMLEYYEDFCDGFGYYN